MASVGRSDNQIQGPDRPNNRFPGDDHPRHPAKHDPKAPFGTDVFGNRSMKEAKPGIYGRLKEATGGWGGAFADALKPDLDPTATATIKWQNMRRSVAKRGVDSARGVK